MAQKYYNSEETAQMLGLSVAEVKAMLDRRELRGFRDGADWKFKVEDIDQLVKTRAATPPANEEGGDVLLSEASLGHSNHGTSGTVIAMDAMLPPTAASDIHLAGSDIKLIDQSSTPLPKPKTPESGSKAGKFEELDLTLDEDLTLDDSTAALPGATPPSGLGTGGSAIDLSGKSLQDDDMVLGGSDVGSNVAIGGDSGISLIDPADSGLSLEQPLDLSGASAESLELGDEDLMIAGEVGGSSAKLKPDEDLLLTPMEEAGEPEGSQVIALDAEEEPLGMGGGVSMAAMLDEDLTAGQPAIDMGIGSPLESVPLPGVQPLGVAEGAALMQPEAALPEVPYSGLEIAGLVACAVLLMLCGMMMYDLLRNMWSWEGAYNVNSSLMDTVLGLFEGK